MAHQAVPFVRSAQRRDLRGIMRLLDTATRVHTHLDWQGPEACLQTPPFYLALQRRVLQGLIAVPPDPPPVAWIRLAAVADGRDAPDIMDRLWHCVRPELTDLGVQRVAALSLDPWFDPILAGWRFANPTAVVVLVRPAGPLHVPVSDRVHIRPAQPLDLPDIHVADEAAFAHPWVYSESMLRVALARSAYATVAEVDGLVVGYQFSTKGRYGGHLARLAVLPEVQNRGVGRALVAAVINYFEAVGAPRVGVNTQAENAASLALYKTLGFDLTGEQYPVWQSWLP